MLLHKNQQEYQETMNQWKQEVSYGRASTGVCASGFASWSFGMGAALRLECHSCGARAGWSTCRGHARTVRGQESKVDEGVGSTLRYDSSSLSSFLQCLCSSSTILVPAHPIWTVALCRSAPPPLHFPACPSVQASIPRRARRSLTPATHHALVQAIRRARPASVFPRKVLFGPRRPRADLCDATIYRISDSSCSASSLEYGLGNPARSTPGLYRLYNMHRYSIHLVNFR